MKKTDFLSIIQKYYLSGRTEETVWNVGDGNANVTFLSSDKSLLGNITSKIDLDKDADIGIYNPDSLRQLLSAVDDEFNVSLHVERKKPIALHFEDSGSDVTFSLADISIIDSYETAKQKWEGLSKNQPPYQISFDIDKSFVDRFIKGVNALKCSTFAMISSASDVVDVILNYSDTNTDRIKFSIGVNATQEIESYLNVNAELFRDILVANKDFVTANLYINLEGLLKLEFTNDNGTSTYFIKCLAA